MVEKVRTPKLFEIARHVGHDFPLRPKWQAAEQRLGQATKAGLGGGAEHGGCTALANQISKALQNHAQTAHRNGLYFVNDD
jgi:hypothetical protein